MSDMAAAVATMLALVCDLPGVVDVTSATRFTDEVVLVTVRGDEDRAEVERLTQGVLLGKHIGTYIPTISGGGDYTGHTLATKWSELVSMLPTASTWGTPMQRYSERLMNDVWRREKEAWNAMDDEAKNQVVADKIALYRSQGRTTFGNCWTGPVSELSAKGQALTDGLEAMQDEVLAAARDLRGVIDVATGFRANGYFSYVTVTPSADEDAVLRRLTDITGGEIMFARFFYPTLSAASRKAKKPPVVYGVRDPRLDGLGLDREDLARQDAALWAQMGELRQSEAIEAEIARHHDAGDTGFGNSW